jgi:hypothetical protein
MPLFLPLVVLAVLVVWSLPDTEKAPTRLLTGLFFSFFILAFVWPDYLAIALPGQPWITVRRLLAAPMALCLLSCLSVSRGFREAVKKSLAAAPLVSKLLVTFALVQLFSVALSDELGLSFQKLIVAQLYWFLPFFVGCYIFQKDGQVGRWIAIFCLILVPLCLSGLIEWRQSLVPWARHIPSFLAVEDESVIRILDGSARASTGTYRVQSTFTTSLGFAEYLALTAPFLIHYAVMPFRPIVRIAALAALPALFFMIILTDSRLGVAGFLLASVVYIGVFAAIRWRHDRRSLFGPAVTLSSPLILASFLLATLFVRRLQRMVWGGGEHQASTEARAEQFQRGLELLMQNPLGYGIGRGADALNFRNGAGTLTIDTYYLLIALDYGVLGFFVYYSMIIGAAWVALKRLLSVKPLDREQLYLVPIFIALIIFIVIKSVFSQDANHPLVFMLMAMTLGLLARDQASKAGAGNTKPGSYSAARQKSFGLFRTVKDEKNG